MPDTAIRDLEIEELEISFRTLNVLKALGYRTVGDLAGVTIEKLRGCRGFGKACEEDLKTALDEAGVFYRLTDEVTVGRIVRFLYEIGGWQQKEQIAEALDAPREQVSEALKVLHEHGAVQRWSNRISACEWRLNPFLEMHLERRGK